MMDETGLRCAGRTHDALMIAGVAFVGFSAAHLIDEFLWGAPQEFHLPVETTLVLALLFVTALAGLLVTAAMRRPTSIFGLGLIGALIAVADIMKHGPEIALAGTWRFGPLSVALAAGLTLSAGLTGVLAFLTWRALQPRR
jgi:hypothetical protein